MKKINIRFIAESAIIAALYVALTWVLAPISYGNIQFRISEVLMLLVVFNPKYSISLIIGCLVANTTSSLGWYDMVFGTLATMVAVVGMSKTKNIYLAALWPILSNGIIVAFELYLALEIDFLLSLLFVSLGEAVVLYLVGIPTMITISKNPQFVELLELNEVNIKGADKITLVRALAFILMVVFVIFFITYPVSNDPLKSTMLSLLEYRHYIYIFIAIMFIYVLANVLLVNKARMITTLILACLYLGLYVYVAIDFSDVLANGYYYIYYLFIIALFLVPFIKTKTIEAIE
ncbi:MAG: QueT transporter family protein [Acholeplasmatales bacterium]|nr:QueT transporter family protein [Acholeplasmatales bacterium]